MTLVLGAHHVCTQPTIFSITTPIGLSIALSTIPSYTPRELGSPAEYHRLGRINLGNALGYLPEIRLQLPNQLVYPLPSDLTLLSVNQLAGVTVNIDEIVSATVPTSQLQPWDRNPSFVSQGGGAVLNANTADTLQFSYTVPSGRKLHVSNVECNVQVRSAPSTTGYGYAIVEVNATSIANAFIFGGGIGQQTNAGSGHSGLILPAGSVIRARYAWNFTTGQADSETIVTGYLFDA